MEINIFLCWCSFLRTHIHIASWRIFLIRAPCCCKCELHHHCTIHNSHWNFVLWLLCSQIEIIVKILLRTLSVQVWVGFILFLYEIFLLLAIVRVLISAPKPVWKIEFEWCAKCNYEFCACVEWCVYCIMYTYIRECAYFCLFYPLLFLKHNITKHNKNKTKFKPKRTKRKFSSVECDWGIRVRLYKCFAADRMKSDVWVWYYFVCVTHICMCG